jgi:hypothetical protein
MFEIFGIPSAALFGQLLIGLINGSFYALLSLGVYRILDSAWTQRTDGVSLRPDEGSVQADSRRPDFAL